MTCYIVIITNDEIQKLKTLIQKGKKSYCLKQAQILTLYPRTEKIVFVTDNPTTYFQVPL